MNFWSYLSQNTTYVVIVVCAVAIVTAAAFLIRPADKLLDKIIGKFSSKKQTSDNNPADPEKADTAVNIKPDGSEDVSENNKNENNENSENNDTSDNSENRT